MPQPAVITDIYQGRARVTFSPGKHTYMVRVPTVVEKLFQPSVTGVLGVKGKPALTKWAAGKSLSYVERKLGEWESKQGTPPFHINTKEVYSWLSEAADYWNEGTEATIGSLVHRYFQAEVEHRAGLGPKPKLPIVYDPVTMPEYTPAMIEEANASARAGLTFLDEHRVEPILLERVLWSPSTGTIGTTDFIGKVDGALTILDYKTSKKLYPEYRIQLAKYAQMYFEEFRELPLARYAVNAKKDGGLEYEVYYVDTYQDDLEAFEACFKLYCWNREHDPYAKGSPVQIVGDLDKLVARPSL